MSMNVIDVGAPPDGLKSEGWSTNEVRIHGFANLSTTGDEGDDYVPSPEFSCFGHQWVVRVYPVGTLESDRYVTVMLINMSDSSIKIRCGFSVRNVNGKEKAHDEETFEIAAYGEDDEESDTSYIARYCLNFGRRSTIMESLVNGSLIIEVRMKDMSTDKSITQFIPTNPLCKNVINKFMDEETADIVFEVDNGSCQNEKHANKKSKTTTTLYAHRFILQDISTMLAELCKSDEGEGITTVSITDVKPDIFKHMIYYAYGGKLSETNFLRNNAKDIINACDKYGVVHLKLEAEASYIKSTTITMDNMIDSLLYADSKNLALLKEAVMDYIVANKHSIMGKVSFSNVPSDMITDVLAAMARGEQTTVEGEEHAESIKYNKMGVGKLRKMLDEKGLDVDGSRESMVALLKENDA